MKKYAIVLVLLLGTILTNAQDKLFKHNGEKLEVKILKVGESSITFSYPGETSEQILGRYAVAKIEYASGRSEKISDKVVVTGEDDWEQVVIIEEEAAAVGLKKGEEVRGKTAGFYSFHTAGSADKKSLMKLKKAAAEKGVPFIVMTADKDNQFTRQSIKKGFLYSYK